MKKRYLDRLSEVIQAPASSPERLGLGPYGAQGKTDVEKFHGKREHIKRLDEFHLGPGDHPSGSSQEVHAGDDAGTSAGGSAKAPSPDLADWPGYKHYGGGEYRTGFYEIEKNAQWIAETEKARIMVGIKGPHKGKVLITEKRGSSHAEMLAYYNDTLKAKGLPETNSDDWTHFYNNFNDIHVYIGFENKNSVMKKGLTIDINFAGEIVKEDRDFPKALDNITKSTRTLQSLGLPADYPLLVSLDWKRKMPTTVGDLALDSSRLIELLLSVSYEATQKLRRRQEYFAKMDEFHLDRTHDLEAVAEQWITVHGRHIRIDENAPESDKKFLEKSNVQKPTSQFDDRGVAGKKIGTLGREDVTVVSKIDPDKLKSGDIAVCVKGKNKGTVIYGGASVGHSEMVSMLDDNIDNYVRFEWSTQFKPTLTADTSYAASVDEKKGFDNIYKSFTYLEKIGFTGKTPVLINPTKKTRVATTVGELEINFMRLVELHLGPGDHPNGSSQDVHAGKGAGASSGVVARSVTDADVEKIKIESGSLESFAKDKLKKLPAEHIDRLEKIEFNEGGLIKTTRQNGESGNAYGTYEPAWNKITLAADQKLLSTAGTVEHEVGHHVHMAKMDTATAQEWASISDNGHNAKISAYARTCAGEHFAEVYRSYYQSMGRRKELQQWEPAAYDFMKNKIANGKGLLPTGEVSFSSWEFRYNPERHANKYNRGGG